MAQESSRTSLRLGDAQLDLLDEGAFRLDGGAMFRVVPRVLWERQHPADSLNRIRLAMRPLLVRHQGRTILVDAGIGPELRDDGFRERLAVEPGPGVVGGLQELGVDPAEVDTVVLTHMHFDHGGGLVTPDGALRFPNAKVVVQRQERADAHDDCPLCKASYVTADYDAVSAAGQLEEIDGDAEIAPGVTVHVTGGHTRAHQIVKVQSGGHTAVCWGDLIPTAAHLRPHYVMAFDLYPMQTYEAKRTLLAQALEEEWVHVLYHEPSRPLGRVRPEGRGYVVEPLA
jgi:glyoxylase-like metal-dependent hydrolase (beta-lactamase superfamily II)